jgi:hypothetical protein
MPLTQSLSFRGVGRRKDHGPLFDVGADKSENSFGVPPSGSVPCRFERARTSCVFNASFAALDTFSTIAGGVPAGARRPIPIPATTDFLPRIHRLGPDAYAWAGCNGRAVALSISLGDELSKAVRGVSEQDLALPFTEAGPIAAHGLLRRLAPLMLMLYRRWDAKEMV